MKELAQRPREMPRSGIREIMDLSAEMDDVIHLEVGDPNFPTPEHIIEEGIKAARDGFTHYTPNAGLLSLRELIIDKLKKHNSISTSAENIIVTPGAVTGVASALMAIVGQGDEILVPDPAWPNYLMQISIIGANMVRYPLLPEDGFLPNFEALHNMVSPATKLILVNSPSNPAGVVWPEQTIIDLLAFARDHDLYILTDEVYEALIFDGAHFSPAAYDEDNRVVSVFGFSKTYAMTGWRLGYVVAPPEISPIITKLQEPLVSCASAISQKAGEAAIRGPQTVVEEMRKEYQRRRDDCISILKAYNCYRYTPQGAFYLLLDVSDLDDDSYTASKTLLTDTGVATAPGSTFGKTTSSYIRISFAAEIEDLLEGTERVCKRIYS